MSSIINYTTWFLQKFLVILVAVRCKPELQFLKRLCSLQLYIMQGKWTQPLCGSHWRTGAGCALKWLGNYWPWAPSVTRLLWTVFLSYFMFLVHLAPRQAGLQLVCSHSSSDYFCLEEAARCFLHSLLRGKKPSMCGSPFSKLWSECLWPGWHCKSPGAGRMEAAWHFSALPNLPSEHF